MALVGDARLPGRQRMLWGTVTLDGSNPTSVDLSGFIGAVDFCLANIQGSGATGADPNQVSVVANGTSIDIYAWKVTTGGAAGNPTEVASTDSSRVIHWFAIGPTLK